MLYGVRLRVYPKHKFIGGVWSATVPINYQWYNILTKQYLTIPLYIILCAAEYTLNYHRLIVCARIMAAGALLHWHYYYRHRHIGNDRFHPRNII